MANYSKMYPGADSMLDPKYNIDMSGPFGYRPLASEFSITTDPRSANQLKAVSDKISTGAKAIEFTGISTQVLESIPDQHLEEINRLKKLSGVGMTFHGPILEPTGIDQGRFDEAQRKGTERQMWNAVERSHKLDPKGNIIVTFHSSASLPDPEQKFKIINEKGENEEITANLALVNERTGQIASLPKMAPNYFTNEEKPDPQQFLKKINTDQWTGQLTDVTHEIHRAQERLEIGMSDPDLAPKLKEINTSLAELYSMEKKDPKQFQQLMSDIGQKDESVKRLTQRKLADLTYSDVFLRGAYGHLQNLYNQAYDNADKATKTKLDDYRKEIQPLINDFEHNKTDPKKLSAYTDKILEGTQLLSSIPDPPKAYKALKEFAIDKAAETFGSLAYNSYNEFKNTAPIISIENPPAGTGISRAEDLRKLIDESRKKFVEKATSSGMLSESQAKKQAEKLLGVTWDVGHINMIRKFGYSNKEIEQESKKIGEYVKHIHLSDNFGYDHTELPMGMGNVPLKGHLANLKEAIKDDEKFQKLKKVVEAGNWYQPFVKTPMVETFSAFGSPLYGFGKSPYWNQARGTAGGYGVGFGNILPDVHFSTYGAGFSGLPQELGGQVGGARSRLSGTPNE